MKRFFSLNVRARNLLWPMFGLWYFVIILCGCAVAHSEAAAASGMTMVNGAFLLRLLLGVAIQIALWSGVALFLLPIMKATIRAMQLDNTAFECEYDTRSYVGLVVGGVSLSVVTCGLYLPWFLVRLMKFFTEGVSHKFNLMSFRAKPMRLFATTVLTLVLPFVVIGMVSAMLGYDSSVQSLDMMSFAPLMGLTVAIVELFFVSLFVILLYRWMINMTYGDKVITTRMESLPATGYVMWQIVLTMLTLGLYTPMAELRIMRYVAERSVVVGEDGEKAMGLYLRPWRDWGWMWVQTLLLIVTLGVYSPWYYAKVMNRFGSRLYVEE